MVIGRTADHVTVEQAKDYVFGYTLMNDVSDRGGRADARHGSDWLLGKSHPTFAPLGPFVVPQEFVPDPQKMPIKFTLSGKVMQDSNTERMTHTVHELVSYASNIITLQPGDIVATGSPAGVGTARETPIYMKAGDISVMHHRQHRHVDQPRGGGFCKGRGQRAEGRGEVGGGRAQGGQRAKGRGQRRGKREKGLGREEG